MDIKQRGSVSVPVYAMIGMIHSVRTQDSDEKAVLFQNDTMDPDGQVDVKIEAGDVVVIVYYESNTHDFPAGTRQGAPRPLSLLLFLSFQQHTPQEGADARECNIQKKGFSLGNKDEPAGTSGTDKLGSESFWRKRRNPLCHVLPGCI